MVSHLCGLLDTNTSSLLKIKVSNYFSHYYILNIIVFDIEKKENVEKAKTCVIHIMLSFYFFLSNYY